MSEQGPPFAVGLRLAKALSHPLRRRLLVLYNDRVASPSDLAGELGQPLGDVSYHRKRLRSELSALAILHFDHDANV